MRWGCSPRERRVDCRADCLDGPCGHRVDDAHRIAVGVGHIQHLTAAGKKQFVGMLLSRQQAGNLERLGVDQRNRRVVPEADVQAFARLVPGQSVRVGIGRQRNQVADCARGRVEPGKRVAVDVGDPQGLAIGRQGQSAGNLEAFLGIGVRQRRLVREQTPGVIEAIDAIVEAAADKELLAVGRPDQTGEGFWEGDPANDLAGLGARRHHLVLAVPSVQDRQYRLARMHGHLHREVSQPRLPAGRLERPAVGE